MNVYVVFKNTTAALLPLFFKCYNIKRMYIVLSLDRFCKSVDLISKIRGSLSYFNAAYNWKQVT